MNIKFPQIIALFLCLILFGGCTDNGPAEMHYGEDQCAYCRMNVADPAFGTQLISGTGKVYRFDSIECLAAFELTNEAESAGGTRWLADINNPGSFLSSSQAIVVRGIELRSPMGLSLAATASQDSGRQLAIDTKGEILSWQDVRAYVAEEWEIGQ